ncbi:MAG TPA: alpha/beta hydrolase [Acidimicrobiia bacterium]|nr:alpha/beta hydrolase [Acidimicrobiia bacterium]
MDSLTFDDIELTYRVQGSGEGVVLIHASPFVSWYEPLIGELSGFSTLQYRRRLRRSDNERYRPLSVAEDSRVCIRLLDQIGWNRAHLVGHSYGALVALQAAIDTPDRVGSVSLLEPAARGISSSEQVRAALTPVIAAHQSGDTAAAVDGFLRHVCGDRYREDLDRVLPNAFSEALAEADLFFQAEMPAVQTWSFGPTEAERVTQPVLNVLGASTVSRFAEGAELIQSWFPHAERLSIPDSGHLMLVQNPRAVAQGLTDFFSRHPIGQADLARSG